MSQAVRDLPDPLEPSPSLETSDPDDLLSKMADEAIDRLIADADSGRPFMPVATPAAAPVPQADIAEPDEPEHEPIYPPASTGSGLVADNRVVEVNEELAKPPVVERAVEAALAEPVVETPPVVDEAPATVAEETLASEPDETQPPASDRQALLAEPKRRTSMWLWPLWLLNLPFSWIGENARRVFGLVGIVTLVPATAAIVYVLWLKHHWGG